MIALSPARRTRGDDGYILVTVLAVTLLLSGLMFAASFVVRSALQSVRDGRDTAAMMGLAQSGLEITASQLFIQKLPLRKVDGHRTTLSGGTVAARIVDEAGKIDLNGSDPKLLQALIEHIGLGAGEANAVVARLVSMRGPRASPAAGSQASSRPTPTAPSSANTAADVRPDPSDRLASAGTQPTQQKQRGFQSIDQLRDIAELTPDDLKALYPAVTVYNPDGKINIMSASRDVLETIPGSSKPIAEDILARRDRASKVEITSLQGELRDAQEYVKVDAGPTFNVTVDAMSPRGQSKTIHAILAASDRRVDPFYILDWWE
jgi:general secretion pathway protein K